MIDELENRPTPVVIYIDSIDQFEQNNDAFAMQWLPKKLPGLVKIVVSTLPDKYNVLLNLQVYLYFILFNIITNHL